jgi:Leucine-rich repeat (LRR) protein
MSLVRSIKRVASFIKISKDIETFKRRIELSPDDMSVIVPYVKEVIRRNEGLTINNLRIAQEYLNQRYNIKGNLFESIWRLDNSNLSEITWMENLGSSNLEILWLSDNKITSLDGLSGLNAPNLRTIWLDNNNIESLKGLRGLHAPNLRNIHLANNKITSLDGLSELNTPNLDKLELTDNPIRITRRERDKYHWIKWMWISLSS